MQNPVAPFLLTKQKANDVEHESKAIQLNKSFGTRSTDCE